MRDKNGLKLQTDDWVLCSYESVQDETHKFFKAKILEINTYSMQVTVKSDEDEKIWLSLSESLEKLPDTVEGQNSIMLLRKLEL
jgi:hypothetical protein